MHWVARYHLGVSASHRITYEHSLLHDERRIRMLSHATESIHAFSWFFFTLNDKFKDM